MPKPLLASIAVASVLSCPAVAATPPAESSPGPPAESSLVPRPETAVGAVDPDRPYWRQNLFRRVLEDQRFALTTWWPAESRRFAFSTPMLAGTLAAGTSGGAEAGFDLRLERAVASRTTGRGAAVARGLTRLGDASSGAVLLGGTYLVARLTDNERLAETTSLSAEALLSSGLWNEILKHGLARARPAGGARGEFFQYRAPPGGQSGSFPSGHAMGAFAVATVFASQYEDRRWIPWVAYGGATLISASRVSLGRHFPSDVMVGALLGHSLGRMVLARRDGETVDGRRGRIDLIGDPSSGLVGIGYGRHW